MKKSNKKNVMIYTGASFIVFIVLYLSFWPVSIDPQPWGPEKGPALTGKYEVNNYLSKIVRIGESVILGSEEIAFDSKGRMYCGCKTGDIVRYSIIDDKSEIFTSVDGPVFGMAFDSDDNLIAAVPSLGLVKISQRKEITVLSNSVNAVPFQMVNGVAIAQDGIIYFTDSSCKYGPQGIYNEIMEIRPNGRLMKYDLHTKTTVMLLDGLYFANGIALGPDDAYLLVCEMTKYRIVKYWLRGDKGGTKEVFIDNLPGMPDGISFNTKNTFWIAFHTVRSKALDNFLHPNPWLKKILFRFPSVLWPQKKKYGFIIGINIKGEVIYNYQDPQGLFSPVSSVKEHNSYLYLGSTDQVGVALFNNKNLK